MDLLEREGALRLLDDALTRARERGCIALVCGEAGIGKSALAAAFTGAIGERGFVAWGRCDALFTPRVLGPAYDIATRVGGELLERIESSASRAAIFAAFLEVLRRADDPVVVFEDVHWADEATLDLIKYLGRRIGETRALLLLTYRDDELGAAHPLRFVLGELPRDRSVRILLQPLSEEAVATLVTPAKAGAQSTAAEIHRATGGNPFFVTEVLAAGGGVPASVRDAVLARAARLSPSARAAADLVSVAPGGLESDLVSQCGEIATGAIAECEERGMLVSRDGTLHFRHEIARRAIEDSLGESRSRELNARVLEALRVRGAEPSRLAHHAEAAGDQQAAVEYARAAAARAVELGSHREAADHYGRAVRFSAHLPEIERGALYDTYAWECHLTGRPADSLQARNEAIAVWRRLGEHAREAESLARLSHLLILLGRNADADRAIRDALAIAAALPPGHAQLVVYRFHSYIRMLERDVDVAIADGNRALELAELHGDTETVAHVCNSLGSSYLVNDDDRGFALLERSLELGRAHGLDFHVANAYGNLGSACGEVNRFREALVYLEQGIAWSARRDLDNAMIYERAWLGLAQLFVGRWSDAAETAQAALRHPAASPVARIMALLAVGRLRARRGDPGAWAALDEAQALAEATHTLQRVAPMRAARAEAAWLAGEDGAAAREAAAIYEMALRKRHAWFVGELAYWQWKGGRAIEAPEFAAKPYALQMAGHWQEAADEWKARDCPYETARALSEGDTDARLEALAMFTELGARPAADRLRESLRRAGVRKIPRGPRATTRAQPAGLTAREVQIVSLIAEGMTNAEIGSRLHISPKTVDHHVSAILAKLGADTRKAAVKAAADAGVVLATTK